VTGFALLAETAYRRGGAPARPLLTAADIPHLAAEPYHRMLVTMGITALSQPYQTILVTSSGRREGKSTVAVQLALALAQSRRRVVLVDANLHQPVLHTLLNCGNEPGLTSLLLDAPAAAEKVSDYLLPTEVDALRFLPGGPLQVHPATLFSSPAIVDLMSHLKAQADVVVFDSAALLEYADAALLAALCDTTIVVVQAGATALERVQQVRTQLEQSEVHVSGFVLNHAAPARGWLPFPLPRRHE
jgi:capsular exopolysaccharide synthesis family protein